MEDNCKLSIIIPVYNAAVFIRPCLDSIISASEKCSELKGRFEIVVVDDGSTDDTLLVLNDINVEREEVVVLTKKNGGVSSARNFGLKHSQGDYILFIDVDDTVKEELFVSILPYINDCSYDFIAYGFDRITDKTETFVYKGNSNNFLTLQLKNKILINIWTCVFARVLLEKNNIRFEENTYYGEDRELILYALFLSKKNVYIAKSLYNYNCNNTNSARKQQLNDKNLSILDSDIRSCLFLEKKKANKEDVNSMKNMLLYHYYKLIIRARRSSNSYFEQKLKNYNYLLSMAPPFQFTKFWVYNYITRYGLLLRYKLNNS